MQKPAAFVVILALATPSLGCDDASLGPHESEGSGAGEPTETEGATSATGAGPTTGAGEMATSSSTGGGEGGAPACAGLPGTPGDHDLTVSIDGEDRRVLVHVPPTYDASKATPLVFALHGFTEGPEAIRDISHWNEIADERGLIVAYPEGKNGSWNGGACCGLSEWSGVNDVGFVAATIDAVSTSYCVDPHRVHASGFSNGGFLSHRLGCELADRIASIGVVAGQESLPACNPARPVAVLQIHGTADPVVPMGGNPVLGYPSTESTVEGWAERDACSGVTDTTYELEDVVCIARPACDAESAVELCTVSGGGHEWPGGGTAWGPDGPPEGFVATLKIADFFEAHPMP